MKRWMSIAAIFVAATWVSAQTNRPPDVLTVRTNTEQMLEALECEWANAVVHRDTNTIGRIQGDEFEFTDPGGKIWTKTRALDFIQSGRLQIDSFVMSEFKVRVYGATAVVNFRVVWTATADARDISGPQRMTDVFVRREGRWQCVSSHTTRISAQ